MLLASFTLLSAACGQPAANGTVIGIRPSTDVTQPAPVDLTAMNTLLADELAQSNNTAAIPGEDWIALGELPVDLTLTTKQLERLYLLQKLGEEIIHQRLTALSRMRAQVSRDSLMSDYQRSTLLYLLDGATYNLKAAQVKIARELLPDQARADVTSVAAFRVYGLLLPKAHLLLAAYQTQQLSTLYSDLRTRYQQQLRLGLLSPAATAAAQALIDDLSAQANAMGSYSTYALGLLFWLDPSGYPGNKSTLRAARQAVSQAQVASDRATNDLAQLKAYIHL